MRHGLIRWISARRGAATAAALLMVLALCSLDLLTGPDLSFLVFYFVPALVATWFDGKRAGLAVSAVCAVAWFLDDVLSSLPLSHPAVAWWNAGTKLLFFAAVVAGLGALKEALERETRAEHERIERESRYARQVQETLLPPARPPLRTLAYAGMCEPAGAVGGDCFDFIPLGPGLVAFTVGDISGKGFPAALLMASLQALVRSSARSHGRRAARLMGEINRSLCLSTTPERYATLFYGVYDDRRRALTYVNAGHNPPLLLRGAPSPDVLAAHAASSADPPGDAAGAGARVVRLRAGGKILGMFPEEEYVQAEIRVEPGDLLVLFTDGLTEAINPVGEEFGDAGLLAAASGCLDLPPEAGIARLRSTLAAFREGTPLRDDLTMVVARGLAVPSRRARARGLQGRRAAAVPGALHT